jgi:hypothetical protein
VLGRLKEQKAAGEQTQLLIPTGSSDYPARETKGRRRWEKPVAHLLIHF